MAMSKWERQRLQERKKAVETEAKMVTDIRRLLEENVTGSLARERRARICDAVKSLVK